MNLDDLTKAEKNLISEFELSLSELPSSDPVRERFNSMGGLLSHEAQTSLLYRLVVMNYLGAAKIARDNGRAVKPESLVWLTQVINKSVDWSEQAIDHYELESITSELNRNIVRFFESFGIRNANQRA